MNIVCFGQQNWEICWSAKQQLLARLAHRGHRVLYVDPIPATADEPGERLRALHPARTGHGVRKIQDGLHVCTPDALVFLPRRLRARWRRRALGRLADSLGLWAPVALCTWPAQRWLLDAVDPVAKVYLAFDDNAGFGGLDAAFAAHQRAEERRLLEEVDLALAVSMTLVERFREVQPRAYLQENGVDLDDFSPAMLAASEPHPLLARLPRPVVGFVGQVDDRIDQDLVEHLARALPEVSVVLAGRVRGGVDFSRLRGISNVHFTGFIDYQALDGVYRELDVGLVPYVDSPLTQACNPLKIYEYLAADLPVVSTDLAGLNSTKQAIDIASVPDDFVSAVRRALSDPGERRAARLAVASQAGWQRRADQLEERLREAVSVAEDRRARQGGRSPRPDRHGRVAVRIDPRLDGKDQSVRELHGNYAEAGLSRQQNFIYHLSRIAGMTYAALRRITRPLGPSVRRILVVRNGHLGDTVVFFPTLAALRRRFPEARIEVAVAPGGGARRLLEASSYVDEVLELDFFHRSRWRRIRGAAQLLARGYDLALGGVWYFHLPEAVFSGAPTRLGLYDGHPLQRYADRVLMLDPTLHETENNLRLAELVCGPVAPEDRVPHLTLNEPIVSRNARALREQLQIGSAPIVCIHAGSKRPSRRWPAASFAEFGTRLLQARAEIHLVLTGAGAEEKQLNERIVQTILQADPSLRPRVHDATDAGDLLAVIGLFDSARLLVCNDTGVMHVARARRTPLLAIIGPENDQRWGPYPLGKVPAVSVRAQVPGTPHGKWDCEWCLSLLSIKPEKVLSYANDLIDGTHPLSALRVVGRDYYPLHRDVTRLSFLQLAQRGLRLPRVAVVLPTDPSLLGVGAVHAREFTPERIAAAASGLRQQQYPNLDVLLVTDTPAAFGSLDIGNARLIDIGGENADAAWANVMATTPAELFFPWNPDVPLSTTAIASRVAVHLRGPSTEAADAQRHHPIRELIGADLFQAALLFTRPAMENLLRQPMNPGRAVSPAPRQADDTPVTIPVAAGHSVTSQPVPA